MKKNKIFIILTIVIVITFLSTAAICNLCGITPSDQVSTQKEDISEQESISTTRSRTEVEESYSEDTSTEEPAQDEAEQQEALESEQEASPDEPEAEETTEDEAEEEAEEATPPSSSIGEGGGEGVVFTLGVNRELCGSLIPWVRAGEPIGRVDISPIITIGDNIYNGYEHGFISFDIRELPNLPIYSARINITDIDVRGDPTYAEYLIIEACDYGDSLSIGDSAIGLRLECLPTRQIVDSRTINISNETLRTLLQRAVNEDKDNFQLRLYFNTTENHPWDNLFINNFEAVRLIVEQ